MALVGLAVMHGWGYIFIMHWIDVIHLSLFYIVDSLVLGQFFDCPNAKEVTIKFWIYEL